MRIGVPGDDGGRGGFAPVDDDAMRDALGRLRSIVEHAHSSGEPLTFFEIHTTAALLAFEALGCDAVVLEAGMGGRLDATTAARVLGVVLTTVSLDHVRQLGDTRAAIAAEKAAAARPGLPLLSGERPGSDVHDVIAGTARERGCPLISRDRHFDALDAVAALDRHGLRGTTTFTALRRGRRPRRTVVGMAGAHQADNASLAREALLRLAWRGGAPTAGEVERGLATARIPARFDVLGNAPLLIVDGAHTKASVTALARTLAELVDERPLTAVFAINADKDVEGCLAALAPVCDRLIACTVGAARSCDPARIAQTARGLGLEAIEVPAPSDALAAAREASGPGGAVVVTGSLYLCGALMHASQT